MQGHNRLWPGLLAAVLVLLAALPVAAQIEDQISAYTGKNATGYLQPLSDAFGADLNDGLFRSAHIEKMGFHLHFEVRVMSVIFGDDDKSFKATTEGDFEPEQTVSAPTIVGGGDAVIVDGLGGTQFAFPGGFDLNSFAIAVPQLRIGSVFGTEALIRYFALDVGDTELGNLSLFGFGLRHSISQYLAPGFPVDLSAGFCWQTFSLGDDLIDCSALSIGVQASRRFGGGLVFFEPYTGLSIDRFAMDVTYESEALGEGESIDLDFDTTTTAHLTLGMAVNLAIVNIHGEFNIASQNSFSFGLAFGM